MSDLASRALGVAAGLLVDRALGEPPDAWHPVAWFGTAMGRLEQVVYDDRRAPGVAYTLAGVGLGLVPGLALARLARAVGAPAAVDVALAVGVASAGRMLRRTSRDIEDLLRAGDLDAARERLPWLVGRDPSGLDASGVAAAVVESLAENTVDAVLAPAFWGLVAGAPGVLVHRAVNTMDAMVGHRSPRHARFGWAAARADDALAWVPARLMGALVALLSGRPRRVLHVVRRDAPAHPSPNAGVAESSVAAAMGVELGGPLCYGGRVELRPRLGTGPRPDALTVARARRLVDRVELALVAGAMVIWWRPGRRTRAARPAPRPGHRPGERS